MILVPNLELYRNWGFHLDATVLNYLKTPKEAMASTTIATHLILWALFILTATVSYYCLRRFVIRKLNQIEPINYKWIPVLLFITASMIIPIRGGFGIAPMNVGFVYFSQSTFANHVAVNPVWNFSYSLKRMGKDGKLFKFLNEDQLGSTIAALKCNPDSERLQVINGKRPNVVVVMLESFTSKAIGSLGGYQGATPNFDALTKEGVLFSNFYAIGDRSKIGIVGLLSGYPSLPQRSVISYTKKTQSMPGLAKTLNKLDYSSVFYYGGDIRFANMNSYLMNTGFERLVTMFDFSEDLYNSKWGVHDEHLFDYLLTDIKKETKPFFKVFFTLSSHEPFDVPMEKVIKGNSEDERFLNSVYYTDKCLGKFISDFKKTEAWENTILILVADHGTRYIDKSLPSDFIKYQIPMLWLGGALSQKGLVIDKIGCQPDLSTTLLSQLDINTDDFIFGKDLLTADQKGYAYFDYNNGFGYIDENERSVFDLTSNKYLKEEGESSNNRENWKALLQFINKDFVAR
jgi:phosphoglycerol transferase MdoB-like AlkP superfamily enzyme